MGDKIKISQVSGLSLVEVVVAMGLVTGLSLVIANLYVQQAKVVKSADVSSEITNIHGHIAGLLRESLNCTASVSGKGDGDSISGIRKCTTPSADGTTCDVSVPVYATGSTYGAGEVRINAMKLAQVSGVPNEFQLAITYEKTNSTVGGSLFKRLLPVSAQVDGSSKIISCSPGAGASAAPELGIEWIKSSAGGGSSWTATAGRWTSIDTGNTDPKRLKIDAYMDAGNDATYTMRFSANSSASTSGGDLILQRNFRKAQGAVVGQFQMSAHVNTNRRYIILQLACSSGGCNTAYFGLTVTNLKP